MTVTAEKRCGNVIASRFPLEELPITEQPLWAQSLFAAVVDSPLGEIEVVYVAFEPTHTVRGRPRYFDHLLVSQELSVVDAGYRHDWREQRLSDHSATFADLERAPPGSGGDGDADASARKTQPTR